MSNVYKILKEHDLIHFYQALTFMAPDLKKNPKLFLIETSPPSNSVKGCEVPIIFNSYLSTNSEIVVPYKARW